MKHNAMIRTAIFGLIWAVGMLSVNATAQFESRPTDKADELPGIVNNTRMIYPVRVRVLNYDSEKKTGSVRFSGKFCDLCGSDYELQPSTRLLDINIRDAMSIERLKEMRFVEARAIVDISAKTVRLISFGNLPL